MEISGKNIIITGGGRGLGKKFAVNLKELGGVPYILDVNQENIDADRKSVV